MTHGTRTIMQAAVLFAGLVGSSGFALADDAADVMSVVNRYAETEGDLDAQARLIRSDRVMIAQMRQTDQAANLAVQKAARAANDKANGGPARWILRTESPEVRIYGNTAVASYIRLTSITPPNGPAINTTPLWVTLVLVKDGGSWGIAHTHVSPVGSAN